MYYKVVEVPEEEINHAIKSNESNILLKEFLEAEQKANQELRELMKNSFELVTKMLLAQGKEPITIKDEIDSTEDKIGLAPITQNPIISSEDTANIVKVVDDQSTALSVENKKEIKVINQDYSITYATYSKRIISLCYQILRYGNYSSIRKILGYAYKELDKQYGICLAQARLDYKKRWGKYPNSALEAVFDYELSNPTSKNLLSSKLQTILKEQVKREAYIFPVRDICEMNWMGEYLIKASDNRSPHGATFWKAYFEYANKNGLSVDWNKEKERCKKRIIYAGKISNNDIIKLKESIQPQVVSIFNNFVAEKYAKYIKK